MRISPSKLDLAERCLWWGRREVSVPYKESEAAEHGKRIHEALALQIENKTVLPTPTGIEEFESMSPKEWIDSVGISEGARAEVMLAMNLETGVARELPKGTRPGASRPYTDMVGTADVVWVDGDRGAIVDWKSGHQHLPDPRESPQLRLYAASLASIHSLAEVDVMYVRVSTDDPIILRGTLDVFELQDYVEHARQLVMSAQHAQPKPGLHCVGLWCPAFEICPATQSAALAAIGEQNGAPMHSFTPTIAITSNEQAAWLYHRCKAATQFVDAVMRAVKDYSDHSPIDLGNGMRYGLRQSTEESIRADSVDAIAKALEPWLPRGKVEELVEWSVTKGAVEKLVKATAPRGGKVETWEAALRSLRGAGCLASKTIMKHAEGKRPTHSEVEVELPMHPKCTTPIGDGYDHRDPTDPDAF